mmetsp:Transcript_17918/g.37188  ORF Transcript_17918/g.37188 Transcript_17918/m.37188 type:complete len:284 (-) Transcript_17918:1337-2188(-)
MGHALTWVIILALYGLVDCFGQAWDIGGHQVLMDSASHFPVLMKTCVMNQSRVDDVQFRAQLHYGDRFCRRYFPLVACFAYVQFLNMIVPVVEDSGDRCLDVEILLRLVHVMEEFDHTLVTHERPYRLAHRVRSEDGQSVGLSAESSSSVSSISPPVGVKGWIDRTIWGPLKILTTSGTIEGRMPTRIVRAKFQEDELVGVQLLGSVMPEDAAEFSEKIRISINLQAGQACTCHPEWYEFCCVAVCIMRGDPSMNKPDMLDCCMSMRHILGYMYPYHCFNSGM